MKSIKISGQIKKTLPVIVASSFALSACSGGQEGDTNGEFAGVGLGSGATTALGVVGGVALVGLLLDSDDGNASPTVDGTGTPGTGTNTGGTGGTNTGGTGGTNTGGTGGTNTGGTGGTNTGGTGGTNTGGTGGTDTGGTGGTDTGGTGGTDTGGTGGTDTGGTGGTDTGGTGGTDTGGTGGTDTGGTGGTNTGGADTGASLTTGGAFTGEILSDQTTPNSGSGDVATSNLNFDLSTGNVSGTITVPRDLNYPTEDVSLMVGPEGSNGFQAIELEEVNATTWAIPANLSAAQRAIVLQNIKSGNLYIAVRTAAYPNGELRRQISPSTVYRYLSSATSANGSTADGYVLVNSATGDYSITWNTSDPSLVSAHLNDGNVNGSSETVLLQLSQRPSNTAQFFAFGNFNDPNDALPNLEQLLNGGQAYLDAHSADDTRVFQQLLIKE